MKIAAIVNLYIKYPEIKDQVFNAIKNDPALDLVELSDPKLLDSSFDKVLVFGGDGTILRVSKYASALNIPILGIDLGNLGFLAEFDKNLKCSEVIKSLKSNKVIDRMLLTGTVNKIKENALNEIAVKSTTNKPIYLDLFVDGEYVDSYHADGVIVSTPTGSTAYSLSAGGPVLLPKLDALLINPVCPHSLHSRPIVVPSNSLVEIKVKKYLSAMVYTDDEEFVVINPNESVIINKAKETSKFVVGDDINFFNKLMFKMNKWGITE